MKFKLKDRPYNFLYLGIFPDLQVLSYSFHNIFIVHLQFALPRRYFRVEVTFHMWLLYITAIF